MSEQQYRVIANRGSMADESWIAEGDRVTYGSVSSTGELVIVHIERPVPTTSKYPPGFWATHVEYPVTGAITNEDGSEYRPSLPTREQIAALRMAHTSGQQLRAIHHNAAIDAVLDLIPQVTREQVESAVGAVLFNASNYPRSAMPHMLGQDIGPLRKKVTDAVLALLQKWADR